MPDTLKYTNMVNVQVYSKQAKVMIGKEKMKYSNHFQPSNLAQTSRHNCYYIPHLENRRIWLVKVGGLEMNYGPVIYYTLPRNLSLLRHNDYNAVLRYAHWFYFAAQYYCAAFIELAQNCNVIHCDITMALNIGSTILPDFMILQTNTAVYGEK